MLKLREWKNSPGRENSTCKGPVVGVCKRGFEKVVVSEFQRAKGTDRGRSGPKLTMPVSFKPGFQTKCWRVFWSCVG